MNKLLNKIHIKIYIKDIGSGIHNFSNINQCIMYDIFQDQLPLKYIDSIYFRYGTVKYVKITYPLLKNIFLLHKNIDHISLYIKNKSKSYIIENGDLYAFKNTRMNVKTISHSQKHRHISNKKVLINNDFNDDYLCLRHCNRKSKRYRKRYSSNSSGWKESSKRCHQYR